MNITLDRSITELFCRSILFYFKKKGRENKRLEKSHLLTIPRAICRAYDSRTFCDIVSVSSSKSGESKRKVNIMNK